MKRRNMAWLLTAVLTLSLILSACAGTVSKKPAENQPATEAVTEGATQTQSKTARPQDDFYDAINAEFLKEKTASGEMPHWDTIGSVANQTDEDLRNIGDEVLAKRGQHAADSAEQVISELYHLSKDAKGREKAGVGPLQPYLDRIAGADSIGAYLEAIGTVRKELGKTSLLSYDRSHDPDNAENYALFLEDPLMLMKKEEMDHPESKEALKAYITALLAGTGTDRAEAEKQSETLAAFYQKLADFALTGGEQLDPKRVENGMKPEEVQAKMPDVDLSVFLKAAGLEGYKNHVVINPNMLPALNEILNADNLDVLKLYAKVQLLHEYAPYLSDAVRKAQAELQQFDTDEEALSWEAVKKLADPELGELYATHRFSPEKRAAVEKLGKDILQAYRKNLENVEWLSKEGREAAIKKIDNMRIKIGYPDVYTSYAKGIVKSQEDGGSMISNAVAIDQNKAKAMLTDPNAPIDTTVWPMSPQTLNARYDPATNEVVFPAAMLQAPFYDEKATYAQNLGGIGAIIGHEITHALDDMGSLYDEKGNYRSWWTGADRKAFEERADKFIKYFGSQEVLPGHKVNGKATLGENIADTGSLSVITSMLGDDKAKLKELFESYARIWAGTADEQELLDQLENDEHAPAKIRVNAVLSTTDAFYKTYDVKPGDKMYVAPEERVKLF